MIRPAVTGDVPALVALDAVLFDRDAWNADQMTEELTGPGRHAWVATDPADTILGYAVTRTVADVTDLQRIGVHPAHRRGGLAAALLSTATARAAEDGVDRMLLEVSASNQAASAFYQAAGFTLIDTRPRYYRDGSDAHVLRRDVAAADQEGRWTP